MTASLRPHKNGNAKRLPAGDVSSEKLWIVLRHAYHALADFLESGVTAKGVAVSDFIVLEVLQHKGELTAAEIGKKTRLAAASVETTIARLKKQNLIGLQNHRGNHQEKHVFKLTDQGVNLSVGCMKNTQGILRPFSISSPRSSGLTFISRCGKWAIAPLVAGRCPLRTIRAR